MWTLIRSREKVDKFQIFIFYYTEAGMVIISVFMCILRACLLERNCQVNIEVH